MEIMKITDTSIKISMRAEEAQEYNLNEQCELDAKEMKKSFARILNKAKREVGFKYAGENIVAEIFSSKDGGYEIFISCITEEEKMYKEKVDDTTQKRPKQQLIYSFEALESLLIVAVRLETMGGFSRSSAYYDKNARKYYLTIEDVSKKGLRLAFINEYARQVKSSTLCYIKEYCQCILEGDAVPVLSSLS
ncbi:MAG: adaptor protein MecA [Clostridia bacterium]|nr:adaptor protein MecA [Clostridia bacterium]